MGKTNQKKVIPHPATIKRLTEVTWKFAHLVLWNNERLTEAEATLEIKNIEEFYRSIPQEEFAYTAVDHFLAYCAHIRQLRYDFNKYSRLPHLPTRLKRPCSTGRTCKWYHKLACLFKACPCCKHASACPALFKTVQS